MTHQKLSLGMCMSKPSYTRVPKTWRLCMGYWPSVRSRWLDIGLVLFLRVYGPRLHLGPSETRKKRTWPIFSHLELTSHLVNNPYIVAMFSVCTCTRAYSSTFQDLDFDVSLSPLFINWCYNHGIVKLPNHWWTRWYYFGSVKFFLIIEFS